MCKKDIKDNTTFKPTHQWQKIEEGQEIPKGLHVRINLKTGDKEAKYLDEKEEKDGKKSLVSVPDLEEDSEAVRKQDISSEELKKVMKLIKADDVKSGDIKSEKFRSYEELKKEFNALNMQVKTDIEIMTGLIENFRKFTVVKSNQDAHKNSEDSEDEEILTTLVDLEYLVHQFDNAQEFAKLNGFSDVIHKSLNSSNGEIRSEALRLHGSATQSNPKVQIAALDSGSILILLKILTFDDDINVKSRSLFALSCLLRRFPAAQHKLLNDGGLTVFAKIFDEEKQDVLKLQIKIITLIHDLLFERKDAKMNLSEEENKNITNSNIDDMKEKLRQYEKMNLEKKLLEQDWCKRISSWLIKQNHVRDIEDLKSDINSGASQALPIRDHHDIIEKVVDTIFVLSDICKSYFKSDKKLLLLLNNLKDAYSELAAKELNNKEDDSSQFYNSLSNILKILTYKLNGINTSKDEL